MSLMLKPFILSSLIFSFLSLEKLSAETTECPLQLEQSPETTACEEPDEDRVVSRQAHIVSIGPEIYHLKRSLESGTKQNGYLVGIRATYDRIKRYRIYWGCQAFYSSGILHGKTSKGTKIRSRWTDEQIEGNVGYTLQYKYFPAFSFTPFCGYGYFREKNKFIHPTPLHVTYLTRYPYFSYGFLSSMYIHSCLSIGANLRFRALWDTKLSVSNDPDYGKIKLIIGDSSQYRVEIPITYHHQFLYHLVELGAVPFYERRDYGSRENFPFDFFETKIKIYGLNVQFIIRF